MNLKKVIMIGISFIFLFSFITHNLYDWFPSTITSIFFPVNESIWEHQKMIFTTVILWGIVEYYLLKRYNIKFKNIAAAITVSAISNIVIFLIIYIPFHITIGHNLIITLLLYLISIVISQIINYYILTFKYNLKEVNAISIIVIPFIFFIFGLLTYFPLEWELLFYDEYSNKHGIYDY